MADQAQAAAKPPKVELPEGKSTPPVYPDFASIIGKAITNTMRDRRSLQNEEKVIHAWQLCATPEEIREAKLQIETGKLAMEALFITFRQMAG